MHAVLLLELVYASAGVYQLLLAREIRMALVANFYFDDVGILGCTGLESSATSTYNSRFVLSMKRQSNIICGALTRCQEKKMRPTQS